MRSRLWRNVSGKKALRACIRPYGRLRRAVLAAVERLTLPVVCNRWARAPAAGLVLRVNAAALPQAMWSLLSLLGY